MIWSTSDVKAGMRYRLSLCQSGAGRRYFKLCTFDFVERKDDVFFVTEEVSPELLLKRNLIAISRMVNLISGSKFYVDPHGMWFTEAETRQLEQGIDISNIKWETPTAPAFVSR